MRRITDQDQIDSLINSSMINTYFDPEHLKALHFEGKTFEDGELIQSPLKPLEGFLFIMEGSARIYGIREDGTAVSISVAGRGRVLGDMEYTAAGIGSSNLYTEAVGHTVCLYLPFTDCSRILSQDITFLNILLQNLAGKLRLFMFTRAESLSLEERTMQLIERESGSIRGVTAAAGVLGCSRRHLQRILAKLCEEGKIRRSGRGWYRVV